jgi:tetratricopeptide (TPR) repeat protein
MANSCPRAAGGNWRARRPRGLRHTFVALAVGLLSGCAHPFIVPGGVRDACPLPALPRVESLRASPVFIRERKSRFLAAEVGYLQQNEPSLAQLRLLAEEYRQLYGERFLLDEVEWLAAAGPAERQTRLAALRRLAAAGFDALHRDGLCHPSSPTAWPSIDGTLDAIARELPAFLAVDIHVCRGYKRALHDRRLAEEAYLTARRIADASGNAETRWVAYRRLGYHYWRQGRYAEAIDLLRRLDTRGAIAVTKFLELEFWQSEDPGVTRASLLEEDLRRAFGTQDALQLAEEAFRQWARDLAAGDERELLLGKLHLFRGKRALDFGRAEAARKEFEAARTTFRRAQAASFGEGLTREVMATRFLASVQLQSDARHAVATLLRALDRSLQIPEDWIDKSEADYARAKALLRTLGHLSDAYRMLALADPAYQGCGERFARAAHAIAVQLRNPDERRGAAVRLLPFPSERELDRLCLEETRVLEPGDREARGHLYTACGREWERRGQYAQALAAYALAGQEWDATAERQRHEPVYLLGYRESRTQPYRRAARLLLTLDRGEEAFSVAERAKSALAPLLISPEVRVGTVPSINALQASLLDHELFVGYFVHAPCLWAWVVARDAWRLVPLPCEAKGIDVEIRALLDQLGGQRDARPQLGRLADLLIRPLEEDPHTRALWARASTVIVSPHGILHLVPFGLLPVGARGPHDRLFPARMVASVPNAATLWALRARHPAGSPLVVSPVDVRASVIAFERLSGQVDLMGACREADTVWEVHQRQRVASVRYQRGGSLRLEDLLALPDADGQGWLIGNHLVHITTHGEFRGADRSSSWLIIPTSAGETMQLSAVSLLAAVLKRRAARPSIVVLNGCVTARGKLHRSDEVLSFPLAFMAGGSQAVVSTLWTIQRDRVDQGCDDGPRDPNVPPHAYHARFMKLLYSRLYIGDTIGGALACAARAIRSLNDGFDYWGGLVLYGDPTARLIGGAGKETRPCDAGE